MSEKNVGSVLVVENDRLQGIVTDRDIVVRCLSSHGPSHDCKARNIMSQSPKAANENTGFHECIALMHEAHVRQRPIGIVSFGDLVAKLGSELDELAKASTPKADEEKAA